MESKLSCAAREPHREHLGHELFSPGPRKPHPNLVPSLKDDWLTTTPNQEYLMKGVKRDRTYFISWFEKKQSFMMGRTSVMQHHGSKRLSWRLPMSSCLGGRRYMENTGNKSGLWNSRLEPINPVPLYSQTFQNSTIIWESKFQAQESVQNISHSYGSHLMRYIPL